jgi:hypothetical protein
MELVLADSDFGDTKRLLIVADFLRVLAGGDATLEVAGATLEVAGVPVVITEAEEETKDAEWDWAKHEYQGEPAKKKRTRKTKAEENTNGWMQEELVLPEPVVASPEPVVVAPEPVVVAPVLPPPTFPAFLMRMTQLIAAGKADNGTAVKIMQSLGLPTVHALADNVGLIPAAMRALDEMA